MLAALSFANPAEVCKEAMDYLERNIFAKQVRKVTRNTAVQTDWANQVAKVSKSSSVLTLCARWLPPLFLCQGSLLMEMRFVVL
jgi:hypothetical protein